MSDNHATTHQYLIEDISREIEWEMDLPTLKALLLCLYPANATEVYAALQAFADCTPGSGVPVVEHDAEVLRLVKPLLSKYDAAFDPAKLIRDVLADVNFHRESEAVYAAL